LSGLAGEEGAVVGMNPGHFDPGGRSFRTPPPVGTSSEDADTTARLNTNRQTPPPRMIRQSVDRRGHDQPARAQRTRRTVDLPAPTHRALDIWQREAADRLGVARVTGQEVLSALIDQLLIDPKLTAQITRAIQARR
jgi:hypothetical protein